MTAVVLSILASAAAAGAGAAAARRSLKGGAVASLALLGVVLAKLALSRLPAMEARLIPWDGYPEVERGSPSGRRSSRSARGFSPRDTRG